MNPQKLEPQTIGRVENGKVVVNPDAVNKTPKTAVSADDLTAISDNLNQLSKMITDAIGAMEVGHDSRLKGELANKEAEHQGVILARDAADKVKANEQMQKENDLMKQHLETKVKSEADIKSKNKEIISLKVALSKKEEEFKKLFEEVKQALSSDGSTQ